MTLAPYIFAVPALLGYCLFVGISGRLNPCAFPALRQDRASWALGTWIGLAVALSPLIITKIVNPNPVTQTPLAYLLPTAMLLGGMILPALVLYSLYRYRALNKARDTDTSRCDLVKNNDNSEQSHTGGPGQLIDDTPSQRRQLTDSSAEASPANLKALEIKQIADYPLSEAVNDSIDVSAQENMTEYDANSAATQTIRTSKPEDSETIKTRPVDANLAKILKTERELRKRTERHLRITRKALSVLENATRDLPVNKANGAIDLEKLADGLATTATLKADAIQEKALRMQREQQILELKRKIINAKREIRRGAAARAKALSTANKSIAFARQSVQIRTRMESELETAYETIDSRQKTIRNLVASLEKEKRRTRKEIQLIARQLVLKERHHRARRSLEDAARSVENNLASRLVKKVAKARPLTVDSNHGKTG